MRPVLLALLLAACAAPHPLDGLNRSGTARAGGHTFRVNWNLETAQATRVSPAWRPDLAQVIIAAVEATETVTGCAVDPARALGDVALVNLQLDCRRR